MGAGRIAPSWDEAQQKFVPMTEANLTLSFDHRVIDGATADQFMAKVKGSLEQSQWEKIL